MQYFSNIHNSFIDNYPCLNGCKLIKNIKFLRTTYCQNQSCLRSSFSFAEMTYSCLCTFLSYLPFSWKTQHWQCFPLPCNSRSAGLTQLTHGVVCCLAGAQSHWVSQRLWDTLGLSQSLWRLKLWLVSMGLAWATETHHSLFQLVLGRLPLSYHFFLPFVTICWSDWSCAATSRHAFLVSASRPALRH